MSTVFTTGLVLDEENFHNIYPFGVDPIWHGTRTELTFLNSVKMKMSIVMGVVHMTLGIVMSLFNHLYFRDRLSLIFEFIPQMIFLWSLFGYLSFLIIFKWISTQHLIARHNPCDGHPGCPTAWPDLYNVMIQMVLSPGSVGVNDMYDGQAFVQVVLLLLAAVAVPTMLLPKPLILKQRHKQRTIVLPPLPWLPKNACKLLICLLAGCKAGHAALLSRRCRCTYFVHVLHARIACILYFVSSPQGWCHIAACGEQHRICLATSRPMSVVEAQQVACNVWQGLKTLLQGCCIFHGMQPAHHTQSCWLPTPESARATSCFFCFGPYVLRLRPVRGSHAAVGCSVRVTLRLVGRTQTSRLGV